MQPVYWFCCWRALARLATGASAWDKTDRVAETSPPLPLALTNTGRNWTEGVLYDYLRLELEEANE